jgi:hypothetical protein
MPPDFAPQERHSLDGDGARGDWFDMARITAANAREMAAKSHEARRQREAVRRMPPQPPQATAQLADYVGERLVRVRVQLDRLDKLMMTESDPQKLDRLASAQARLSEQERILDGRPLPGSRRPGKQKSAESHDIVPL